MASVPTDDDLLRLAERVGRALARAGAMLAAAESCTGGWVAQAVTAIAGSSAWFDRGFVTYSNAAKSEMLGVPEALIREHGAVSEPVARAMAEGALAHSRAHAAVAITGIAGPSGGTPEKPVGTVWFAWAGRGAATRSARHLLRGDREAIRRQSVAIALEGLLEEIE
ncbi:MAG TPA: nicotinamide-nucleotide amidase [Burkholderiales bacterium]